MAIITLARQVAALGDEVGAALAEKLNYKFIKRTDIEQRIVELGFPKSKMIKYDERKPGFFASIVKNRDDYFNLSQFAVLEAAKDDNVVIIGRGSFITLKNVPDMVSVRLVADNKTRVERLKNEFNWDEKQAKQRIFESDNNRTGFHKNFYNIDVNDPANYDMTLNTGKMDIEKCVNLISDYVKIKVSQKEELESKEKLQNLLLAQNVVLKLIFEYKVKIEFVHIEIEDKTAILYGVCNSQAIVEQALQIMRRELPEFEAKSAVSVVQEIKSYQ